MRERIEKRKYIDLFAGCGGVSLGLHNSGLWQGVFAVEKSPMAFETLKYNLIDKKKHFDWPDWLPKTAHDIHDFLEKYSDHLKALRNKIDLIVGGPPCQGFSVAGKRDESDERNQLIFAYLKVVELVQPKFIFFENVKGFMVGFKQANASRGIPYSQQVIDQLTKQLNYKHATPKLVDFSNYGVPQRRERCIIVASLDDSAKDFFVRLEAGREKFLKKKGLQGHVTIEDALSDLLTSGGQIESPDSPGFMHGKYFSGPITSYQKLLRKGVVDEVVPDSHRLVKHRPEIKDKYLQVIQQRMSNKQIRENFPTRKTTTTLLKSDRCAPTLTTLTDDFIHYAEPRVLTVREYARIQSFNDWYQIRGKYTTGGFMRKKEVPRYTQLGNAVPPLFMEQAGLAINSGE